MRNYALIGLALSVIAGTSACSLNDLVSKAELPVDQIDPAKFKTHEGALDAYRGTIVAFANAIAGSRWAVGSTELGGSEVASYIRVSGLLTDELQAVNVAKEFPALFSEEAWDSRNISESAEVASSEHMIAIQHVRNLAQEARGLLRKYAPDEPAALHGHLYALEAYAELLLADLYCSGIPLSTVDFEGDFTLTRGFTTQEVYAHAITLFDSAASLAADSSRIVYLADVGRGRAYLALGEYAEAKVAVHQVPDQYQYLVTYATTRGKIVPAARHVIIADREGQNGLPFVSGGDPRTTLPALFSRIAPLILASGVEARLIEAEVALRDDSVSWLDKLNALRTTCTDDVICPVPAPAGIGGVANLSRLSDPSTATLPPEKTIKDARIDLLFEERAYWFFLTGHRQGDLRRLVREYQRDEHTVYPTGTWGTLGVSSYGSNVNIPVDGQEVKANPLYRGCFDRNA